MKITLDTTIEELLKAHMITARTFNGFRRNALRQDPNYRAYPFAKFESPHISVNDIQSMTYREIMDIRNIGSKSADSLCAMLSEHGFHVKGYEEKEKEG